MAGKRNGPERVAMIHPDTELTYINSKIGYGVVATRPIPRGTITWAGDELDQVFPPSKIRRLCPVMRQQVHKYSFRDAKGRSILCWDNARFINHSCSATCLSAGFDFELAVRDIQPGEELTDDYGTLNIEEGFECYCMQAGCRGTIFPDDLLRYAHVWDQIVRTSLPYLNSVPQPLWPMVKQQRKLGRIAANHALMPSLATHYYPAPQPADGW
jgi:hypothetical protein